jgi:hypothetical protein
MWSVVKCTQMQFYWSSMLQATSDSKQRHKTILPLQPSSSRYLGYGVMDPKVVVRFPVEKRQPVFAERFSPNPTPTPTSYSMGNGGPLMGLRGQEVWSFPLTSIYTEVTELTSIIPHDFIVCSLTLSLLMLHICGVSKILGVLYPKKNNP